MRDEKKAPKVSSENKKIKPATILMAVAILLLFCLGGLIFGTYQIDLIAEDVNVWKKIRITSLPGVVLDGGRSISLAEIENNFKAMRKFYETQDYSKVGLRVDFSTEDGKKRLLIRERELLNKMVEDRFMEILAKEQGIVVSLQTLNESVERKMNEYGNKEDVLKDLSEHYGWTIEDFKTQIVLPDMYKEALMQKVAEQNAPDNERAKELILQAQKALSDGQDFALVAKQYSQGSTANEGGELGWVSQEQLTPELGQVLFGEKMPEKNAVLESSLGYHIVEIEEKKKEQNQDVLRIRQIFVRKNTFTDWLDQQIRKRNVRVLVKGFVWNKEKAMVDFKTEEMRNVEKELLEKSQGDASLIF